MNIEQYLERIGYTGVPATDIETLAALCDCHVRQVPFEDLDIQAGVPIRLNTAEFFDKVVIRRRGGYCYELNGLFCELLVQLGFRVHMLSARVANGKAYSPEYDHMCLAVEAEGIQWLVDVGFGDFSLMPLKIDSSEVQSDGRKEYLVGKLEVEGKEYYSASRWNEGRGMYVSQYIFSLQPHALQDFAPRNQYQQTNAESHFMKTLMCSLPTENGRISMINNRMVYTKHGERYEEAIRDEAHRRELLRKYFKIEMVAAVFKCVVE